MKIKRTLAVLFCLVFVTSALWSGGAGEEAKKTEGKPYAGVEIVHGGLKWHYGDSLKEILPEFEEETGIKVLIEQFEPTALSDKLVMEASAKSDYFDTFYLSPGYIGQMVEMDFIHHLDDLLEKNNIDLKSMYAEAALRMGRYPGVDGWLGIPHSVGAQMIAYRKSFFEDPKEKSAFKQKYGYELKPPENFEQLLDVAEFFTRDTDGDGKIDVYGFAQPQGSVGAAQQRVQWLFWSIGSGEVYDKETKSKITINTKKNADALRYGLELDKYEPPETVSWFTWEQSAFFSNGKVAMIPTWFSYVERLLDPQYNELYQDTGVSLLPGNYQLGGGAWAISKYSSNKDAAFEFLKWVTSREIAQKWIAVPGGPVTRSDSFTSEETKKVYPLLADYFPLQLEAIKTTKDRITLPQAAAMNEVLFELWHDVKGGKATPEEGLVRAEKKLVEIFKRAGYIK